MKAQFNDPVKRYIDRIGYNDREAKEFLIKGHRTRQVKRLSAAAPAYTIEAKVVRSRHCNSGHTENQILYLDVDGNIISKLCPKKICIYLLSQLTIPVALINERLSEGLNPNDFHFMRYVHCPDVGVECLGYGEVILQINVVPRQNK